MCECLSMWFFKFCGWHRNTDPTSQYRTLPVFGLSGVCTQRPGGCDECSERWTGSWSSGQQQGRLQIQTAGQSALLLCLLMIARVVINHHSWSVYSNMPSGWPLTFVLRCPCLLTWSPLWLELWRAGTLSTYSLMSSCHLQQVNSVSVLWLDNREIGPRSRVWSEREFVDKAAFEFSEVSHSSYCHTYAHTGTVHTHTHTHTHTSVNVCVLRRRPCWRQQRTWQDHMFGVSTTSWFFLLRSPMEGWRTRVWPSPHQHCWYTHIYINTHIFIIVMVMMIKRLLLVLEMPSYDC